jgi:tetratricopeptide (TPR) repeat protein
MLLNLIPFFETTRPSTITQQYLHHAYTYAKTEDYHCYALRIAFHLGNILREQSNLTEAEAVLLEGLSLMTPQDTSESIDLLTALTLVLWEQNRFSEALNPLNEAIARAEPIGKLSHLYCTRGILASFTENIDEAEHIFLKAYEFERSNQTSRMRAIAMINLGETCGTKGNFALGQHYLQEAFQIADTCTYRDLLSPLHQSLGLLAAYQGEYDRAQHLLEQALEEATSQNLQRRRGYILVDFSLVFLKLGDVARAQAALQEVSALIQQDDLLKVLLLLARGRIALEQRNLARAGEVFQEALAQSHPAHQSLWHRCEALLYLGITMQRAGDLQRAQTYLQEGSALAQTLRRPQLRGEIHLAWGEHFLLRKDYRQAEAHFSEIIESIPHGFRALIAEAQAGLASVAAGQQRY